MYSTSTSLHNIEVDSRIIVGSNENDLGNVYVALTIQLNVGSSTRSKPKLFQTAKHELLPSRTTELVIARMVSAEYSVRER